jgi:Na+/phosphate symporter
MSGHFDPLSSNVDVRKLLSKLYFAEEDYRTANLEQPSLMLEVAKYRIQLMRSRMTIETADKLLRSKWAYKYRKKTRNGKPLTEAGIKEKVEMNKYVHRSQRELNQVTVDEELAKQLFEVFKQRQVAINNIIKANSNSIAKDLWELEKGSSHEKLRAAAKAVRGKYSKYEKESEE